MISASGPKKVRLALPPLHEGQKPVVFDKHRFLFAACGSKWGKTHSMAIWLLMRAWNMHQSLNWWVAPINRQARIAFHLIGSMLPPGRFKPNLTDLAYDLLRSDGTTHSRIEFRSADNAGTLRGDGVHSVVCDEAAYWKNEAFVSVMTTLTRTRGYLRAISTPKGKSWFYEEWLKGWQQDEELAAKFPEHASYRLPTSQNPFIPRDALKHFEDNMPSDVFKQEILAEFLDDSAGVFRNVSACANAILQSKPSFGRMYVIGADLAKKSDFTVLTVMDRETKKVVHFERYNEIDWNLNIDRIVRLAKQWNNASIVLDSTGVGDMPFDTIRAVYPHLTGYLIGTNAAKVALIQKLQLAFERQEIAIPNHATYKREFEIYGYDMSATGKFLYSAPDGFHDDCVISCALAYWGADQQPFVYKARNVRGV